MAGPSLQTSHVRMGTRSSGPAVNGRRGSLVEVLVLGRVGTRFDTRRHRDIPVLTDRTGDVDRDVALEPARLRGPIVLGEEAGVEHLLGGRPRTCVGLGRELPLLDAFAGRTIGAQAQLELAVRYGDAAVGDLAVAGIAVEQHRIQVECARTE